MYVMFILMGASLLAAVGFLIAFFWAVRNGQFDDRVTPSYRILFDSKPSLDDSGSGDAEEGGQ